MTEKEIRSKYKEPLTLSNVREILRISKVSATWLLQSGYLKCEIKGTKMHQYSVMIDDLVEYINKTESGELIVPFPKRKHNTDELKDEDNVNALPLNPPAKLKEWLTEKWSSLENALPRTKVIELTGFSERTLKNWASSGKIKITTGSAVVSVKDTFVAKMVFIKKDSLIDYLCSDEGFKAIKRSGKASILPTESPEKLKEYLITVCKDFDENLTHADVVKITGFSLTSTKTLVHQNKIESFIGEGNIKEKEVTVSNMTFIDKQSLIDYLCGEGYYTKQKPQAFKDLLKKFLNK